MSKIWTNAGFALALQKLSPFLSPNEKSWGQPRESWGQILRSWGQMNNGGGGGGGGHERQESTAIMHRYFLPMYLVTGYAEFR